MCVIFYFRTFENIYIKLQYNFIQVKILWFPSDITVSSKIKLYAIHRS